MPKVKVHRSTPLVDMTAMTDVAFLLLTFFMLTAKMRPSETVTVDTPGSVSETEVPTSNIITISVDPEGRVFFLADNQAARKELMRRLNSTYSLNMTEEELDAFGVNGTTFGAPAEALKGLLDLDPSERDNEMMKFGGIPCDTAKNELGNWIYHGRFAYAQLGLSPYIIIKGDNNAKYPKVQQVINTLKAQDILKFNLITDLEVAPNE